MKKPMITVAAIALTAIMATPATAQMRMRGNYGRGPYYTADITKLPNLNLTSGQIKNLNELRAVHLSDIEPLRKQMYSKSMELKGLWLEQKPDYEKIALLQNEIQTLRNVIFKKVSAYRRETLNILTAQQQKVLESCKEKRNYGFEPDGKRRGGMRRQGVNE
jgi:Spy/CpxP family protein refolding chaperone